LTDGALLGLCSASAVSSFLPVLRLGLVNPEGYIAFPLFPHLSDIPQLFSRNGLFSVLADRMSLLQDPRKRDVVLAQGLDIRRVQADHLIRHGWRLNCGKGSDLVLKTKGGAVEIAMSTKPASGMEKEVVKLPLCQRRGFSF